MDKKEYSNYLFDLYGTLVDIRSSESGSVFWKKVCWLLGMQGASYTPKELEQKYKAMISALDACARAALPAGAEPEIDLAIVFRAFFTDRGIQPTDEQVADFARSFRLLSLQKLRLYPGTLQMLDALHRAGKKVYLLSNAQALFTRPELTLLGLDQKLDGILLSSEAGRKKPDPVFYHRILTQFDLDPHETIMVGNDDICDCHGAEAAGLDSLYINTRQSPSLRAPLPISCRQIQKISDVTLTL